VRCFRQRLCFARQSTTTAKTQERKQKQRTLLSTLAVCGTARCCKLKPAAAAVRCLLLLLTCLTASCACWPPWLLLACLHGQGRALLPPWCAGSRQALLHTQHSQHLQARGRNKAHG
jgi:hypothetical protein